MFDLSADSYARFMGRFAEPLADQFVELVHPEPGQRALDVGSGTGVLTTRLVDRLGGGNVAAIDPSPSFVAATSAAFDEVDVRLGIAEELPWADGSFDLVVAQLVVHFMHDPVQGLREMLRVARPGGPVAACVWDHAGQGSPLTIFWRAVHDVDPDARDESALAGAREGHLAELFTAAGGDVLRTGSLEVVVEHPSFEDWWEPYTLGVGPAGAYVAALDQRHRDNVMSRARELLPPAPFTTKASAWYALGSH